MDRVEINQKIKRDITDKITPASITPPILGEVLTEMTNNLATLEELEKYVGLNTEQFITVPVNGIDINISNKLTPYARIQLTGDYLIYNLNITAIEDGATGKILIHQTGYKQIMLADNIIGELRLPNLPGTIFMMEYNVVGDKIYFVGTTIVGDSDTVAMPTINDLTVVYYDSQSAQLKWTAPHGNTASDKITGYEIRYAGSVVDANDPAVWIGLKKFAEVEPKNPGEEQNILATDLLSGQEYYVYIKSYQLIYGGKYLSKASNFAYFRTPSSIDAGNKAYRIKVAPENIYTQVNRALKQTDGSPAGIWNIVDEQDKNQFYADGYPNILNKDYQTYWQTFAYGRNTAYYRVTIDLQHPYNLDKIFIYSAGLGKFSVYVINTVGAKPKYIGESLKGGNNWTSVDFNGESGRFVILQYDLQEFGAASTSPAIPPGEYGVPNPYYNWDLGMIHNMLIYGSSIMGKPDGIKPVLRKATQKRIMSDWLCVNGHFYQSGRLHSKISGPNVRLYGHPGQFNAFNNSEQIQWPQTLASTKFRLNRIPWVYQNGPGYMFQELLEKTYKPYGLKPIICATGVMDYVRLVWNNTKYNYGTQADGNVYPGLPQPLPKNVSKGLDEYLNITTNPQNYKSYAKLAYALASKFGKVNDDANASKYIWNPASYPTPEPMGTGLDLLGGFEPDNEMDRGWQGMMGFLLPEIPITVVSSCKDGHEATLFDENGDGIYGAQRIDPNFQVMHGGLANNSGGYVLYMILHGKSIRNDFDFPSKAINMHLYFSSLWLNDDDNNNVSTTYAVSPETTFDKIYATGKFLDQTIKLRNYFVPEKELWMTEFGYGEAGVRGGKSQYQCFSMPGRIIDGVLYKDRHRSDVKGSWIVRAMLVFLSKGFDQANLYITFNDDSWWGNGGGGNEMFYWDSFTDETPGAKFAAIEQFESPDWKSGFSAFGMFGNNMWNGGYPISRAFWYVALFRNTLGDYTYLGRLDSDVDPKIQIHCFKKKNEDKGAYLVYYNDIVNTGVPNTNIPVPSVNAEVSVITEYIPKIVDPAIVPIRLGADQFRTGIPTSRREKYINGQWVIQNRKPDDVNFESYSLAPANYPANPVEGDVVVVLPTPQENPYFPIVGPVGAKAYGTLSSHLAANQYEVQENVGGDLVWTIRYNTPQLSWRQADAIADYIDYHEEGKKGTKGVTQIKPVINNTVKINVSEFPTYILFDGIPNTSFHSVVTDLSSKPVNSTTVKLYWNNNNVEDTDYEIFISDLPETGYSKHSSVPFGTNEATINGLLPNTVYYFKVRPIRDSQLGSFSEPTSVRPFSFIPDITNLEIGERTTGSIQLTWEYPNDVVPDFYAFAIYRDSGNGIFNLVTYVTDNNAREYTDTGLGSGVYYTYKMRAIGLNGQSSYTQEVTDRTLLVNEDSPVVIEASTDKLGTSIILKFNIDIEIPETNLADLFTLTEDGNPRLITNATVLIGNNNQIKLTVPDDTLAQYTERRPLLLTYAPTSTRYFKSIYQVKLKGFTNLRITNKIGNFTNKLATYNISFGGLDTGKPETSEPWNYLYGPPDQTNIMLEQLVDIYTQVKNIKIYNFYSPTVNSWGGISSQGVYGGYDLPDEIAKVGWNTYYGSNKTENFVAKLLLEGLNPQNRYKVTAFGSRRNADSVLKLKVNGSYSNSVNQNNNLDKYIEMDDIQPDSAGKLTLDFITDVDPSLRISASLQFMRLEEFSNDDTPPNTFVYIKTAVISEAISGVVKDPAISIIYSAVGVVEDYRISELEDFSDTVWAPANTATSREFYTIQSGFGQKTIYFQLRNSNAESNIKVLNVEYKDPYEVLVLQALFINNDDKLTYSRNVNLFASKVGIPTHYRAAEDEATVLVSEWQELTNIVAIPFTLSAGTGTKTVFLQLKDSITESEIKSDSIDYEEILYSNVQFVIDALPGNNFEINPAPLKYNKFFAYSMTSDDGHVSGWNVIFKFMNGMWIDDLNYYHMYKADGTALRARTTGAYAPRALHYTDGLGVKRRFVIDCTIDPNPGSSTLPYPNDYGGDQYPFLVYHEYREIIEFDGSYSLHDVKAYFDQYAKTVDEVIYGIGKYNDELKIKMGYKACVMTQPNGDTNYIVGAEREPSIKLISATSYNPEYKYINLRNTNLDVNKLKLSRYFVEGVGKNGTGAQKWIDDFNSIGYATNGLFGNFGMHGADRNKPVAENLKDWPHLKTYLNFLHDTYGEGGNDSMWMATPEEVAQYKIIAKFTEISYSTDVANNKTTISLRVPNFVDFRWKELTLLISDIDVNANLTGSANLVGLSYGPNSGKLMINMNLDDTLLDRAEKYTSLFEYNESTDNLAAARYFIQRLKPELQESYNQRINIITVLPELTGVTIDQNKPNGVNTINIKVTPITNGAEKSYMISENSNFTGATWKAITPYPLNFELSDTLGNHIVYLKTKNDYGESSVKSANVIYYGPDISITSFTVNNGQVATGRDVPFGLTVTGFPTDYRISENSDFSGAEWKSYPPVSNEIQLSEGYGTKMVYVQIRNAVDTVGSSATVSYQDPQGIILNSVVVNNDAQYTGSLQVSVKMNTNLVPTHYRISGNGDFTGVSWIAWTSDTVDFTLLYPNSVNSVTAQVRNANNESSQVTDYITHMSPVSLTQVIIGNGTGTVTGLTQTIVLNTDTGNEKKYRLAESQSALDSAPWLNIPSGAITFTFSGTGSKTLYAQVQNEVGNSNSMSQAVTVNAEPLTIIHATTGTYNMNAPTTALNGKTVNTIRLGSSASWTSVKLYSSAGTLLDTWKYNTNSSFYTLNAIFPTNGAYNAEGPSPAIGTPVFQLDLLKTPGVPNGNAGKLRLSYALPAGTYRVRLLWSTTSDGGLPNETLRTNSYYGVYLGETELAKVICSTTPGFTALNNQDFNATMEFTIASDSNIDIAAWNTVSSHRKPGMNIIEITKLS